MGTYITFGSHSAQNADIEPVMANVCVTSWNRMYPKLRPRPILSESPIPPFRLRLESDAPMMVSMNDANDIA